MHIALRIEEIIAAIFPYLHHSELALCARTCRAWFLSAVQTLWFSVNFTCAVPQILMASGLLHRKRKGMWDIPRFPSQKEWDRLFMYTSHIRRLKFVGLGQTPWSPRAKYILLKLRHGIAGPLFPHVGAFHYGPRKVADIHFGNGILPRLPPQHSIFIDVFGPRSAQELDPLWSMLHLSQTTLTSLHFSVILPTTIHNAYEIWSALCSTLQACTSLEAFENCTSDTRFVRPAHPEVFNILARLPRIKRVTGHHSSNFGLGRNAKYDLDRTNLFPELETLSLEDGNEEEIYHHHWFPPNKLQNLEIRYMEPSVFTAVVDKLATSASSVHNVYFHILGNILGPHLHKLSRISKLRFLTLRSEADIEATDEDMECMASGLLELEGFTLETLSVDWMPPTFSLLTIKHFIKNCRNIRSISVALDATCIPPLHIQDCPSPTARKTIPEPFILYTPKSPLEDPTAVADWLAKLCSSFQRRALCRTLEPVDAYGLLPNRWTEVDALVEKAILAQERPNSPSMTYV